MGRAIRLRPWPHREEHLEAVAEDVYRMLESIGREDLTSWLDGALAEIVEGEVRGRRRKVRAEKK